MWLPSQRKGFEEDRIEALLHKIEIQLKHQSTSFGLALTSVSWFVLPLCDVFLGAKKSDVCLYKLRCLDRWSWTTDVEVQLDCPAYLITLSHSVYLFLLESRRRSSGATEDCR